MHCWWENAILHIDLSSQVKLISSSLHVTRKYAIHCLMYKKLKIVIRHDLMKVLYACIMFSLFSYIWILKRSHGSLHRNNCKHRQDFERLLTCNRRWCFSCCHSTMFSHPSHHQVFVWYFFLYIHIHLW